MTSMTTTRRVASVLAPTAVAIGALVGAGPVAAAEPAPAPGILGVELDEEEGRPTLEVDFVDLQGVHREIDIDLQTGRIVEDVPEG